MVENPADIAANRGPVSGETLIVNGQIEPQDYNLEWPGGTDTPGNRNLPTNVGVDGESHFDGSGPADPSPSPLATIPTLLYNFADQYNLNDPSEHNEITAAQEQLVRDIFQLYGNYLGVKFQETYSPAPVAGQLTVATGDLAAVGGVSGPGGVIGEEATLPNGALEAVMDGAEYWDNTYGIGAANAAPGEQSYFETAMHEIGHMLGYGHDDETPELSMMDVANDPTVTLTQPEDMLPSSQDIATGLYMYRTDSSAIDLYQFTLPVSGTLSLETIAQRMQNSSTLNTNLVLYNTFYDSQGNEQHQEIASNDNYFGTDSYIHLVNLPAGTYYVGVSASGNDNYNPNIPLSGMNGKTQGPYEMRISFAPAPAGPAVLLSDGNISLDNSPSVPVTFTAGTAPLTAGTDSAHPAILTANFSTASIASLAGKTFQVTQGTNTFTFQFVDSSNPTGPHGGRRRATWPSPSTRNTDSVTTILQAIANAINNAVSNLVNTTATPLDGDYDGNPGGQYNYWFNVQDPSHTLYVDKIANPAAVADGSMAHPFTTVQAGLDGPCVLRPDGNITLGNAVIPITFTPMDSGLAAGTDYGLPAITGINSFNIPNMAALNGLVFQVAQGTRPPRPSSSSTLPSRAGARPPTCRCSTTPCPTLRSRSARSSPTPSTPSCGRATSCASSATTPPTTTPATRLSPCPPTATRRPP